MPADQLLVDVVGDVLEVELALLFREAGVKHDLDQHVAQFLAHVRVVPPVDRIDQLARLIDQAAHQRGMRLLLVPGTTAGAAEPRHRGF